jgi:arylsulfatase A-like enzyme
MNATAADRPNIIYINADDLGVMDVGYQGQRYRTPHIDRLRQEGMLFTNAYAPAANCAPSRACCMTGQNTPRHGVYTVGYSDRGDARKRRLIPIENTEHISEDALTMADVLQSAGYKTIHLGKWHIGKDPLDYGFDVNIGGDGSGSPAGGYFAPFARGSMRAFNDQYPAKTHRVDIFADQAIRFLQANQESPCFVYFSTYSVHSPLQPVPEFVEHYDGQNVNVKYASMIEKLDQAIGKVLAEVDRLGLREKTLVVFTSDNGGIRAISSQSPFRSGKGSYFEGGIRVPMVVRWPGHVAADSTCDEPVTGLDLFPTFLDVAGIEKPAGHVLDGASLVPLLKQTGSLGQRPLYWHFPIYLQAYGQDDAHDPSFRTRPGSVVRFGKWKLHEYFEDGRLELYNIDADVREQVNVAAEHPAEVERLHSLLLRWRKDVNAPAPSEKNPAFFHENT